MAIKSVDHTSVQSSDREIQGFLEANPDIAEAIETMLHNALGARGFNPDWVTWEASFLVAFQEETFEDEE
jgi:hypothetical protein